MHAPMSQYSQHSPDPEPLPEACPVSKPTPLPHHKPTLCEDSDSDSDEEEEYYEEYNNEEEDDDSQQSPDSEPHT